MKYLAPVRFGAEALALRLRLEAMMRRSSLPALLRSLTKSPSPGAGGNAPGRAASLAALQMSLSASEDILARVPIAPDTCLYRALTRYAILRSAGYPARFVMGVRPGTSEIAGHAWVELAGEPVGEELDPDLVVTYAYPDEAGPIRGAS
jgi:hypothetical protein